MAEVLYKCLCMGSEAAIQVVDRDPTGDIVEWIERIVTPSISYDHTRRSPYCRRTAMEYAKLPVDEATGSIGAKPRHS
jgi:hypothetical protein